MKKPFGVLDNSYFIIITLSMLFGISTIFSQAYADTTEIFFAPGAGSSQNCVNFQNCVSPNIVNISLGNTITWINNDNVGHTTTSGFPTDAKTGIYWDSSLIRAGSTYSFTFQNIGDYHYFCMVHPWITGQIIVSNRGSQPTYYQQPTTQPIFGGTIMFDQKVYRVNDKAYITVVAPTLNYNPNFIDTLQVSIQTTGYVLPTYTLTETGSNTGIFTGVVTLVGNGVTEGTGPSDGSIGAQANDNIRAIFDYGPGEVMTASALISSPPSSITPSPFTINVQTDASSYAQGSLVTITVNTNNMSPTQSVDILLNDPSSKKISGQTVTTDAYGKATIRVTLPLDAPTGTYSVLADMWYDQNLIIGGAKFTVSIPNFPPPVTTQPSQSESSNPHMSQESTLSSPTAQLTTIPQPDSVSATSSDGLVIATLNYQFSQDSTGKKSVHWYILFEDHNGQQIPHSNYAITVMQDGNQVLSQTANYAITGAAGGEISGLNSFDPLGFKITYLGTGLQYAGQSSWTGPKGYVFNLEIPKLSSNNPSIGLVTVTTDKKAYNKGDLIAISGSISESTSGDSVKLELDDPGGSSTQLESARIQDDKTFSLLFTADDSIWKGAGTYTLKASYGNELPSTTTFVLNKQQFCFLFWCW